MSVCFSYSSGDHRDLHSFPTRRSSDLIEIEEPAAMEDAVFAVDVRVQAIVPLDDRGALAKVAGVPPRRRANRTAVRAQRSEEHTSELQSLAYLVCRLLLEKKNQ